MSGGGKRPGAGRKPGSPNKLKASEVKEVKALAQQHAPEAMARLAFLAQKAESEAASVAACNSILDRAYGKAAQSVDLTVTRNLANLSDAELEYIASGGREGTPKKANGSAQSH